MVQRPVATLERLLSFPQKPYAIQEKDGKASPPVVFSEPKEVLKRIAKKFWPGPIVVYLESKGKLPSVPLHSVDGVEYLGISNSSHPLTKRLLQETSSDNRVVIATPSFRNVGPQMFKYMTKAEDVCAHFTSHSSIKKQTVHVLNGEDKREHFCVPTCHYKEPYKYSLWIQDSTRTVFIRGAPRSTDDKDATKAAVVRAMLLATTTTLTSVGVEDSSCDDTTDSENLRLKNRNRVMTAVLRQWKVVDQRPMTTTSTAAAVAGRIAATTSITTG